MRADVLFDMRVGDDAKLNLSKMLYIPVKDKCDFWNVSGANTLGKVRSCKSISPVLFTVVNSLAHEAHHLFKLLQLVCLRLSRAFQPVVVSSHSHSVWVLCAGPKGFVPKALCSLLNQTEHTAAAAVPWPGGPGCALGTPRGGTRGEPRACSTHVTTRS